MAEMKLEALHEELRQNIKKLNSEFDRKYQTLTGQINEMKDKTDELESMHKSTTVGSLVGGSVAVAAGVTALVGALFAPITFGVSLVLTGAGIIGGVTGAGFSIANMVIQKKLHKNIEKIVSDFQNTINPMIQLLNTISKNVEELHQKVTDYSVTEKAILTSVKSVKTISSITKLVKTLCAVKIGSAVAKSSVTIRLIGKIANRIALIFSIYGIVTDSVELHEMNSVDKKKADKIKSETLKFIHQMKEAVVQFQETLDEIKCVRDKLNEAVERS